MTDPLATAAIDDGRTEAGTTEIVGLLVDGDDRDALLALAAKLRSLAHACGGIRCY